MVSFNPEVQQVGEQNYLGWAKGIKQPENLGAATGIALDAAGKTLEGGIKAADFVNKTFLEEKMFSTIDAKRDEATAQLESVYEEAKAGGPGSLAPGKLGSKPPTSIVYGTGTVNTNAPLTAPAPGPAVPPSLETALPAAAERIDAAKASGKYSATWLNNQYNVIAKDFRSRYPQYRDFIDHTFEKITGENPSNAYIRSLLSDINSYAAKTNDINNKITTELLQASAKGNPEAQKILEGFTAGLYPPMEATRRLNATMQGHYQRAENASVLGDFKGNIELQKILAERVVPEALHGMAKESIANLTVVDPQGRLRNVQEYMDSALAGKEGDEDAISEMWTRIHAKVMGDRIATERRLENHLSSLGPAQVSWRTSLGGDTAAAQHKNAALVYHDLLLKGIGDKNTGLVGFASMLATARGHDTLMSLYNGKGGELAVMLTEFAKIHPQFAMDMFQRIGYGAGLAKPDADSMKMMAVAIQTRRYDPRDTSGIAGSPTVPNAPPDPSMPLNTILRAAKADGLSNKATNTFAIDVVPKLLADPKQPVVAKIELARNSFAPQNSEYIGGFEPGTVRNGRIVPGRREVWDSMTSRGVTDQMAALTKITGDKTIWDNYKAWAQDQFGRVLFRDDVAKLNDLATATANRGFKFTFQPGEGDKPPKLGLERTPVPPGMQGMGPSNAWDNAQRTVNNINSGLANLHNIAHSEGSNSNAYVVNLMLGVSGNMNPQIHQMLMDALKASQPPEPAPAETPSRQRTRPPSKAG